MQPVTAPSPAGPCRYCGTTAWQTDPAGPVHACCLAWRRVIAAGYRCPACTAGRWLASPATRNRALPPLPALLPDGTRFAPDQVPAAPPPCTSHGPAGPCGAPACLYPCGWRCPGHAPRPANALPEPQTAPSGLTLEAAALRYMRAGWPVFVLGRSKRPVANCSACKTAAPGHDLAACACLTCHGFHAATTDPARLAAMLRKVPGGLLAIRTGTAAGLAVVDIDPRNGGTIDRALMTPTATVATGGGGWHLYYRHPGGPLAAARPGHAGVDVKADGGYVVAPPSVHPGTRQRYRWTGGRTVSEMPPALRAALAPAPAPDLSAVLRHLPATRRAGGISSPSGLLAAHLRAVQNAPEGRRRATLYGAARGVARMVAAGALTAEEAHAALTTAGQAAGQTPREIRAAISGAFEAEGAAA
jgi:hypothetical protein